MLILDEPTSGLDPVVRQELLGVLREVRGAMPDRTVVFSTHILEDLVQVADAISLVRRGTVYPCVTREAANHWQGARGMWQSDVIASVFGVETFA